MCVVRAYNSNYVPTCAQDGNKEAARALSDYGAHTNRDEKAALAQVATTAAPTTNPTTCPTGLPTPQVPISNKMKLLSFAREYENITSPSHARLEKDKISAKLEIVLLSRTRYCYTFHKLWELIEYVVLNSGMREFT